MLGFATSVARKAMRVSFISLLSALLLQGCGGGGDDDPTARAQQAEEARLASLASHYVVSEVGVDSFNSEDGLSTKPRLLVIDTRTNSIVFQVDLKGDESPRFANTPQWRITYRQEPHADQLGTDALGANQLIYILDGQVMQLDLSGDTLGTPRRLTPMKACSFGWNPFAPEIQGQSNSWVLLSLLAEDGSCTDPATQTRRFLRLDAPSGDTGVTVEEGLLGHLRNADGSSLGFLAIDRSEEDVQLVLLSLSDLKTRLQTLPLENVAPISPQQILFFGEPLGGDAQQSLIQIGQVVHGIDWRGGEVRIGAPILTMHENYPAIAVDRFNTYVADGCVIHQIDATGAARVLTTVPGNAGGVSSMMTTGEHLLVRQSRYGSTPIDSAYVPPHGCVGAPTSTPYADTLRVMNIRTGITTQLPLGEPNGFYLMGHASGQVYITTYLEEGGSDIIRYDLSNGAKTVIAKHVDLISDSISPRQIRFGSDITRHQLMWCQRAVEGGYGCREGDDLISHTVSTGRNVTLGKMPALHGKYTLPDEPSDYGVYGYFEAWEELFVGNPGVMTLTVNFYTPERSVYLSVPWMVTPGVAGSLREIPYDSPRQP